jgi:hypothetical protein
MHSKNISSVTHKIFTGTKGISKRILEKNKTHLAHIKLVKNSGF